MLVNLLIKYKQAYICEKNKNMLCPIQVPNYACKNPVSNVSIFITLLLGGFMQKDYTANCSGDYAFWEVLFEDFFSLDYLKQVDINTFLYDVDAAMKDCPREVFLEIEKNIAHRPKTLIFYTELTKEPSLYMEEIAPFTYSFSNLFCDENLKRIITLLEKKRQENDVLLLYSGGKDSTLAAIRLEQMGYRVHFLHFNNGYMLDQDKPYLTFKELFSKKENYFFDYALSNVTIQEIFERFFASWKNIHGDALEDATLTSEICCLSCRMAMYQKAIEIARMQGFHFIAEGARSSQKFMIEQESFIKELKNLASSFSLTFLFPVLTLEDDQALIQELLSYGLSSKTWESKCLLGRKAKEKTEEEEKQILAYYTDKIKPKILALKEKEH